MRYEWIEDGVTKSSTDYAAANDAAYLAGSDLEHIDTVDVPMFGGCDSVIKTETPYKLINTVDGGFHASGGRQDKVKQ